MSRGARAPRGIEAPEGGFDDFRTACGNAFGGLDQKVSESLWDRGHYPTVPVTRGGEGGLAPRGLEDPCGALMILEFRLEMHLMP